MGTPSPDAWPLGDTPADMALRARLAIAFADGLEEAGFVLTARRLRAVARDVYEVLRRYAPRETS